LSHVFDPPSSLTQSLVSMSICLPASAPTPSFQPILDKAVREYKKKTRKDLITDPLAEEIRGCDSPQAIFAVLRRKADGLNQSQSSDERLTKWLMPTVNVLNALSFTLGQGVGTVNPSVSPSRNCVLTSTFRYFLLLRSSFLESIFSCSELSHFPPLCGPR
jgi:hypothetical protein